MLYIATGSNLPQFYVYTPSVAATVAPTVPPLGEWCHMVGTYDGATISLYINGVLVGTTSDTGSIATNANDFEIGRYYFSPSTYNYDGVISSVRLWRRALPIGEVASLYYDPWDLYRPARPVRELYRGKAAGGGAISTGLSAIEAGAVYGSPGLNSGLHAISTGIAT
jgi:hypothetical protein